MHERLMKNCPWHAPPHRPSFASNTFHITAACYQHSPYIGHTPERMDAFSESLLAACKPYAEKINAWCVLPNHYHLLLYTRDILSLLAELGRLHGRTSYTWNGEEQTRGRQVFHRAVEREMRSERHFFATLNYVHHNPVHHHYVERWDQWPWGSAAQFIQHMGREEALCIWKEYPVRDYGAGWDDPDL
jgi:putative transposase